ncbi:unnamed protein product [Didymodactylos carnosus]|uniref:Uncharacterized protein n=1 Tax=Didymodactylos carnosus TaxID=1234261 RepID=A0A813T2S1_9BILA|nr:unnamed protein product [Didymodactylos carnosus]CAF1078907.1 unnamed protein product [Didymodactylos carnosus]CAF3593615.1 unnamed protein product [Didymodactylos carnosus]CAF3842259.1 unnamed protein product [Didymodactylos carnosus]
MVVDTESTTATVKTRADLQIINEVRTTFTGTFEKYGTKRGRGKKCCTVLMLNICELKTFKPMCDHLWFNRTKGFEQLQLTKGQQVQFNARVKTYRKGSIKRGIPIVYDYKLSYPTKFKKL